MLGSSKITLFEKISDMCKKISNASQKILLDMHHHMHQHMIEDIREDAEDTDYTDATYATDDNQEILTIKIIKVDYDYIIKIIR